MKTIIVESRKAIKDLGKVPKNIAVAYEIWARLVEENGLSVLRNFKGYHDEKLSGSLKNLRSSRLNKKWRVIYQISSTDHSVEIVDVVRISPHEYRNI